VGFSVEYESFSFVFILTYFLFESCKSKFVESETIYTKNFDLDHTHTHFDIKRLVDLEPTTVPK